MSDLPQNHLINPDIAPTPIRARSWNVWHIASLWVGMSVCIPTYMLAASMIQAGMSWQQSLLAVFLGNAVVLLPLVLNAHAGTKYGIPFPVFVRSSFGIAGAHIPALLRSLVACGWFGIQTWIGGMAVNVIIGLLWADWQTLGRGWEWMGYGPTDFLSFLIFWLVNIYFVWAGTESIKWLETLAAPFLILMGVLLLIWAAMKVGGLEALLQKSDELATTRQEMGFWPFFVELFMPWLTAMVGYWATLSLNIPDFTRYARSQRDQVVGQAVGLLTAMPLYAFIGVAVTSATVILYGEAIWNPVELTARLIEEYQSPVLGIVAMLALVIATLSTNIAANVVAPANSISNLMPPKIGFRLGGLIAGVVGILILPWKLLDMYQVWLISYSGLLGAVGGVIICDYFVIRKTVLSVRDLYREEGEYRYWRGFNQKALIAMGIGIITALMGKVHPSLGFLFNGAWFFATGSSFLAYFGMMRPRS